MGIIHKAVLEQGLMLYARHLNSRELSRMSVKKYVGDITRFLKYLEQNHIQVVNEMVMAQYRHYLENSCAQRSCNSYFISLNKFFKFLSMPYLCLKLYKVPPKLSLENVLSIEEYNRLLKFTDNEKYRRSHLIMKTLGCTGIRISELKFITYESLLVKKVEVTAKSKTRTVYLSEEICGKLQEYGKKTDISSGMIFRTKYSGRPLDSGNIWRELKLIAGRAGVDEKKVYPHSFRHLFAKTYIEKFNALDELADILGHSSIETTRIYTRTTGEEKRERLNLLGL